MDRSQILDDVDAGLSAYALGQPFTAHEHFESAWHGLAPRTRTAEPESDDRRMARALVQLAAAEVKRSTRSPEGVAKLLAKAEANLVALGGSAFGLDPQALAGLVTRARATGEGPLTLPPRTARVGVLYLHGFASSPRSSKAVRFAEALAADGVAVRIPALDGGRFYDLTLTDALARARRSLFDRTLVVGSSMGGYLATLLGPDPRVAALVLMAPAFDLARRLVGRHGDAALAEWRQVGWTEVDHYGTNQKERISAAFLDDAARHPAFPVIARPAYVLHGRRDATVPVTLAEEAAVRAAAPVELELVDDDHALAATAERAIAAARRLWATHVQG